MTSRPCSTGSFGQALGPFSTIEMQARDWIEHVRLGEYNESRAQRIYERLMYDRETNIEQSDTITRVHEKENMQHMRTVHPKARNTTQTG